MFLGGTGRELVMGDDGPRPSRHFTGFHDIPWQCTTFLGIHRIHSMGNISVATNRKSGNVGIRKKKLTRYDTKQL